AESGSGWSDPTKGAPAASVLWQYDAAGNIRSRKASYHVITEATLGFQAEATVANPTTIPTSRDLSHHQMPGTNRHPTRRV
ncbi:hypothetical protein, partial [Sphingomonas sp. DT-204]|uniref:hypothetical protein n=1 Tax=Sphingomonas sp. DT-204 TaxID=3396166 RepID=UPI003F1B2633